MMNVKNVKSISPELAAMLNDLYYTVQHPHLLVLNYNIAANVLELSGQSEKAEALRKTIRER